MVTAIDYKLDDKDFKAAINDLTKNLTNMHPVFKSVSDDWYKQNKTLFKLKSKGQYIDYRGKRDSNGDTEYMRWKRENAIQKAPYPMLKAKNGRIEAGLTDKSSVYTVRDIDKNHMTLGVKGIEYAIQHQLGSEGMPQRPFIFNAKIGGFMYQQQMKRWINIIKETQQRRIKYKGGIKK